MSLDHRPSVSRARSTGTPLYHTMLTHYPTRMMLALIVSMIMVTGLLHVPVTQDTPHVGWFVTPFDAIELSDITSEVADEGSKLDSPQDPESGAMPPPTAQQNAVADTSPVLASEADATVPTPSSSEGTETGEDERPALVPMAALHGTNDQMPEVLGGLGTLYLNIHYPEAARRAGIQGRLIVEFTVDTEGNTQNIHVARSLHALCDSAAVEALARTRFAPGRLNGKRVPVRMYLPIRFRLIDATGQRVPTDSIAQASAHESGARSLN